MGRGGVTATELADSCRYLVGSMPRVLETNARHRQLPPLVRALRPGTGLRPPAARAARAGDARRGERGRRAVPGARPRLHVPWQARDGEGRVLRRRLHADLPGADVPRRGVSPLRRAARAGRSTRRASAMPCGWLRPSSTRRRATSTIRPSSIATRPPSSRPWGAAVPACSRAPSRSTTSGRRTTTSTCTTMCRTCCARLRHGASGSDSSRTATGR